VDELRLLHETAPEIPVESLWQMATIRGARALRMAHRIGSISEGNCADLVAFPATGDDPLRALLESRDALPHHTWIAGREIQAADQRR